MEFVHCIKLWFMWKTAVRLVRSIDIDMRAYWDNCMQWQVVLLKNQRVSQEYGFHAMTQRNNSYAITKGHNCHAVTQGYNSHLVIRLSCILFLMQQSTTASVGYSWFSWQIICSAVSQYFLNGSTMGILLQKISRRRSVVCLPRNSISYILCKDNKVKLIFIS